MSQLGKSYYCFARNRISSKNWELMKSCQAGDKYNININKTIWIPHDSKLNDLTRTPEAGIDNKLLECFLEAFAE